MFETKHRCPLDKYIFEKRSAGEVYDFNRFLVSGKHQEVFCGDSLKGSGMLFPWSFKLPEPPQKGEGPAHSRFLWDLAWAAVAQLRNVQEGSGGLGASGQQGWAGRSLGNLR